MLTYALKNTATTRVDDTILIPSIELTFAQVYR